MNEQTNKVSINISKDPFSHKINPLDPNEKILRLLLFGHPKKNLSIQPKSIFQNT